MSPNQVVTTDSLLRRQSLEAVVHRACKKCGAPAQYLSHESIENEWGGCWVPTGHPKENTWVGDRCPNCGAFRPLPEEKGEIWAREWRWSKAGWRKTLGLWAHKALGILSRHRRSRK